MTFSSPQFWERIKLDHGIIEGAVSNRLGSYQGLMPEALYTSLEDIFSIVQHPLVKGTLVDLGAGVGLLPLIYGALYPERRGVGVEFEKARIQVGQKIQEDLKLENVCLKEEDLFKDEIPKGDCYFLYFPTGMVLDRILSHLYEMNHDFLLVAVESHGDLLPRLSKENWLQKKTEIPLASLRHYPSAVVFERLHVKRNPALLPHELSYEEQFLLIEDSELWIGETLDLSWTEKDRYELTVPPRTIEWSTVKEVMKLAEVPSLYQRAIELRRRGELEIKTRERVYRGFLRKIIIGPTFKVEISSGEKVEWGHILSIKEGNTLCYESC